MIHSIHISSKPGFHEHHQERLAASVGLTDLEVRRAYFIETSACLSGQHLEALQQRLADPVLEQCWTGERPDSRHQAWVAYQRGIVDNESDSIVALCSLIGIKAAAAKVVTVYSSSDARLHNIVRQRFFNPNIEEVFDHCPVYETLLPLGQYTPMETCDLRGLDDDALRAAGLANGRNLDPRQMRQIQRIQIETGAPYVTDVLLEALDARWSDHCYHTTWKALGQLLKRLIEASRATANPNILSMFEDNAGVWDFYDGQAIALKAETHNGPSAVSAYFGQLTKLGGVLRDILGAGLGADPFGVFEYTATGVPGTPSPVPGRPAPEIIAVETIRAIKEYGNTFGTPMMWSRMCFHPAYRAKPFALGGCVGVLPREVAGKGQPQPGDLLMLLGGLTGNDGIHGASASSAGAVMDTAAVQIGSPLEEVKFRAAIMDLRDEGAIRAVTDVGGAGLNSAIGEMGDPCGVWLNSALVPLKAAGLPMWRILLSESQERMILAIKPETLAAARRILERHEVRHTVIGKFTGLGRYTVAHDPNVTEAAVVDALEMPMTGEVGIDVPYTLLKYEPEPAAPPAPPATPLRTTEWPAADFRRLLPDLLADVGICDQSFADSQYDSSVQGRRCYGPYESAAPSSFWAVELIPGKPYAALFTTAFNPWLFEANPRLALRQCFFEALSKLVLAGAKIRDIALCDNFYTPHIGGEWAYWLVAMVDELAALVREFGTPVLSGKDSSAGSVRAPEGVISVPPAVFLSALGKAPSFDALVRNEWRKPDNLLVRIGPDCLSAAGTAAARVLGLTANDVDEIPVEQFHFYLKALESLDRSRVFSGIPVGPGGLLATLARASIASGFGVELSDPGNLLAEHRAGAIVEVEDVSALAPALMPRVIGRLTARGPAILDQGEDLLSPEAIARWKSAFEESLR